MTIVGYEISETKTLKGYWNGKNYNGVIYLHLLNEETMEIDWKKSVKLPYDISKMSKLVKTTEAYNNRQSINNNPLPTTVEGWMKLMERMEK